MSLGRATPTTSGRGASTPSTSARIKSAESDTLSPADYSGNVTDTGAFWRQQVRKGHRARLHDVIDAAGTTRAPLVPAGAGRAIDVYLENMELTLSNVGHRSAEALKANKTALRKQLKEDWLFQTPPLLRTLIDHELDAWEQTFQGDQNGFTEQTVHQAMRRSTRGADRMTMALISKLMEVDPRLNTDTNPKKPWTPEDHVSWDRWEANSQAKDSVFGIPTSEGWERPSLKIRRAHKMVGDPFSESNDPVKIDYAE